MAQNRTGYRLIDDTEVDAESPITESLMFALRDQYVGSINDPSTLAPASERLHLPERAKTNENNINKFLAPNGSGGVFWRNFNVSIVTGSISNSSTTAINLNLNSSGIAKDSNFVKIYIFANTNDQPANQVLAIAGKNKNSSTWFLAGNAAHGNGAGREDAAATEITLPNDGTIKVKIVKINDDSLQIQFTQTFTNRMGIAAFGEIWEF